MCARVIVQCKHPAASAFARMHMASYIAGGSSGWYSISFWRHACVLRSCQCGRLFVVAAAHGCTVYTYAAAPLPPAWTCPPFPRVGTLLIVASSGGAAPSCAPLHRYWAYIITAHCAAHCTMTRCTGITNCLLLPRFRSAVCMQNRNKLMG